MAFSSPVRLMPATVLEGEPLEAQKLHILSLLRVALELEQLLRHRRIGLGLLGLVARILNLL